MNLLVNLYNIRVSDVRRNALPQDTREAMQEFLPDPIISVEVKNVKVSDSLDDIVTSALIILDKTSHAPFEFMGADLASIEVTEK